MDLMMEMVIQMDSEFFEFGIYLFYFIF